MTGRLHWKSLLWISRRGSNADGNLQRAGLRQCIQEISRYPSMDSSGVERLACSLSSLLRARRCISRRRPWSNGKTAPFSRGSLEEPSVLVCSHVADSRPWGICDPHHSQGGQDYRISRGSHWPKRRRCSAGSRSERSPSHIPVRVERWHHHRRGVGRQ